jgi:hypothetical protein
MRKKTEHAFTRCGENCGEKTKIDQNTTQVLTYWRRESQLMLMVSLGWHGVVLTGIG